MPKSFNWPGWQVLRREPQKAIRVLLGALLVLNLVALYFVFYPPGGSPQELDQQLNSLRTQILQRRAQLDRTRKISAKVERGRQEGDRFLAQYFLAGRTAYSSVVGDLIEASRRANIRPKDHAYVSEPVEGSEQLSMLSVTANYEGTYADLLHLINEIDRLPRLLIIENLQAQPQAGSGGLLNISLRLNTFVREEPAAPPAAVAEVTPR
jgi:Tfp pilus assembly protein PilO